MRVPPHQQQQRRNGHDRVEADANHRRWRAMFVIAHAQGQKNQPAEQRQNKQQKSKGPGSNGRHALDGSRVSRCSDSVLREMRGLNFPLCGLLANLGK